MTALHELYQEVILDHNKSPRNFGRMENPDRKVDGYNPLCGDHFTIFLKLKGNVIEDIRFDGSGCAISKASASVMCSIVKGKTIEEAEKLFQIFHKLVTGDPASAGHLNGYEKMAAFAGVSEFPARVKCATLAWHTLHAAIGTDQHRVSTE